MFYFGSRMGLSPIMMIGIVVVFILLKSRYGRSTDTRSNNPRRKKGLSTHKTVRTDRSKDTGRSRQPGCFTGKRSEFFPKRIFVPRIQYVYAIAGSLDG